MAALETTVTQPSLAPNAEDPNVHVPDHVKAAAAAAEALHAQAYTPEPTAEEIAARAAEAEPPQAQIEQPAPELQTPEAPIAPAAPEPVKGDGGNWEHRYYSMEGRWKQSQRQLGQIQQQMQELGDELLRTQAILQPGSPAAPTAQNNGNLIKPEDVDTYGQELIDVVKRGALEAVGPELQALRTENQDLKKRVTTNSQRDLKDALTRAVPDWQAINRSPQFNQWLRLRNVYTNEIRGQMLNTAYQAADAPKVIAFFRDFQREVLATGQTLQTPAAEQQVSDQQVAAPRQAAVNLQALAAPGRAKPAGGENNVLQGSADKPVYTRAQISKFYADVRARRYEGREAEKTQIEQSIFAAQADGRVR